MSIQPFSSDNGFSTTGNVTAGNILIVGSISPAAIASPAPSLNGFDSVNAITFSASGNITGDYFIGNGSQLTGVTASANTGNVTFNDITIQGTGDEYGGSGLYLAPGTNSTANLQYLRVRGGDYPTHIHLDTGNNQYFDQYFGADSKFVKLEANGNIVINADDLAGNTATWTFSADGNLTFPSSNLVITPDYAAFGNAAVIESVNNLITLSTGANGGLSSLWVEDYANIGTSNIAAVYANPVPGSGNVRIAVGSNGGNAGPNLWDFDGTGNLTAPGNINLGNAALQSFGANYVLTANSQNYDTAVSMTDGGGVNLISTNVGVQVTSGTDVWTFNTDGSLTFPDASTQTTAYTGGSAAEAPFSIQTNDFTATIGSRYGVNTTGGGWIATLPASPATGDAVYFADAGGAYSTNPFIVNPGINTIMGAGGSMTVTTNGQSFGLFWNGTTWRTYS